MRSRTPNPEPRTPQRFSEVDSLRAIACALVIIEHTENEHGAIIRTLPVGYIGVLMFFAISGFVIPSSLRGARWQGFKHFVTRRFWRLYPPLWVALSLMYIGASAYRSPSQWFAQMTMLPRYLGSKFIAPHFWTLEVELVFYAVVGMLFLLIGRLSWRVLGPVYLLCGFSVIFPSGIGQWLQVEYLIVMFWGALCRETLRINFSRWAWLVPVKGIDWARSTVLGLLTGFLVFRSLGAIGFGSYEQDSYSQVRGSLALPCAVFGFLFWVIFTPVRIDWLSRLGRATYSTYLLHWGVIAVARRTAIFFSIEEPNSVPMVFTTIVTPVSFAIGAIAYRWIEKPSDAIGKRLTRAR